jgi:1,4-dihydroxy-6-naphthoate synthase
MKLTLGFSPCPNDTFIFDALVNQKIDTGGIEWIPVIEDVETLNKWAIAGKLDVSKLSFPAFFESTEKYVLLDAGAALGKGVGPLLVEKPGPAENDRAGLSDHLKIQESVVALPGEHTTANLLFSFAFPEAGKKKYMIFSSIEDAVLNGEAELGVIIHENRFTYKDRGLSEVLDLGNYWEEKMKLPIPLGGIAAKRDLETGKLKKINQLIRQSVEYAFSNYPVIPEFVKIHAQSMQEEIMRKHIDLYVNEFSIDTGSAGRQAIEKLYEVYLTVSRKTVLSSSQLFLM